MPYKKRSGEKLSIHEKRLVQALCGDFKKRAADIERAVKPERVLEKYICLNDAITSALDEVCAGESEKIKLMFLDALGDRRGHNWSPLCTIISPTAFYERKYRIMLAIARNIDIL